jgi:hypothetical protein
MEAAGKRVNPDTEVVVRGFESFTTAKLASLRVGRLENEIYELSQDPETAKIEVIAVPYNPEPFYTMVVKSYRKDGTCPKAILEVMRLTCPGMECELYDAEVVEDRRKTSTNDVPGVIIKDIRKEEGQV